MVKYIYEYDHNYSGIPFKNQYTVIYENKTFYYCKVNGVDALKQIEKRKCDNPDSIYFTSEIVDLNMQMDEKLRAVEIAKLEGRIKAIQKKY